MEKVTGRLENQAQQGQRREQGEKRQSERGTRGRNVTRAELTSSRWVVGFCFFFISVFWLHSSHERGEERRGDGGADFSRHMVQLRQAVFDRAQGAESSSVTSSPALRHGTGTCSAAGTAPAPPAPAVTHRL